MNFLIYLQSKYPVYPQKFRKKWLTNKEYEKWLGGVDGDDSIALCHFCGLTFKAKKSILDRHKLTNRHKQLESQHNFTTSHLLSDSWKLETDF